MPTDQHIIARLSLHTKPLRWLCWCCKLIQSSFQGSQLCSMNICCAYLRWLCLAGTNAWYSCRLPLKRNFVLTNISCMHILPNMSTCTKQMNGYTKNHQVFILPSLLLHYILHCSLYNTFSWFIQIPYTESTEHEKWATLTVSGPDNQQSCWEVWSLSSVV